MKHIQNMIASGGVIAAVVAAAHADSVYVQLLGEDVGRGVVVSLSGGLTFADGTTSNSIWAGGSSMLVDGQSVRAFSAELTGTDGDGWYEKAIIQGGPSDEKARALGALFAGYGGSMDDSDQAATFQAMIWEIVYDFDGSDRSIDMAGGKVAFGQIDGALFDLMKTTALRSSSTVSLATVSNDHFNDHLLIIPLPSGAAMAGLGLVGLAAKSRRRA